METEKVGIHVCKTFDSFNKKTLCGVMTLPVPTTLQHGYSTIVSLIRITASNALRNVEKLGLKKWAIK